MMPSCQNSLGVGIPEPPIINAVNASSGLSAREIGTENIDAHASNTIEAPANSAMVKERQTCRLSPTATPRDE
jgi:hypothetical protein